MFPTLQLVSFSLFGFRSGCVSPFFFRLFYFLLFFGGGFFSLVLSFYSFLHPVIVPFLFAYCFSDCFVTFYSFISCLFFHFFFIFLVFLSFVMLFYQFPSRFSLPFPPHLFLLSFTFPLSQIAFPFIYCLHTLCFVHSWFSLCLSPLLYCLFFFFIFNHSNISQTTRR